MSFLADIKTHIETNIGVNIYPFHIPENVKLPAIKYIEISNVRDSDANLDTTNIKRIRIQFNIVTNTTKSTLDYKEQIENLYENLSGTIGLSNVLIARVQSTVALYNNKTQTYEYAIDVIFKVLI